MFKRQNRIPHSAKMNVHVTITLPGSGVLVIAINETTDRKYAIQLLL